MRLSAWFRPGEPTNDRGLAVVLFALTLTVLIAMAALAIDLGNARQESRHAQASSDAAALAGAQDLPVAAADAAAAAVARQTAADYAASNLLGSTAPPLAAACAGDVPPNSSCFQVGSADVVVASPYVMTSSAFPAHSLIYVRICQPTATFFAGALGGTSPTVCREAVARRVNATGGYGAGLVSLHPTACGSMLFGGDGTTTLFSLNSNGAVLVNSNCEPNALDARGSSWELTADYIGVVGGASLAPCDPEVNTKCTDTVPQTGINPFADPLALPPPATPPTTRDCNPSLVPGVSAGGSAGNVRVLEPGRYTTSCTWNAPGSTNTYILRPGVYYMDTGFTMNGNANFVCVDSGTDATVRDCSGVTFYVASGAFTINGDSTIFLPPPTTGPYAGVTVFQGPGNASTSTISGASNTTLIGTVYAPSGTVRFRGNATINVHGAVIGSQVDMNGNFELNIAIPDDSDPVALEDDVGLEG